MDAAPTMTIEQLLCSDLADERVELVAGVVHRMTPAGGRHGLVCANALSLLWLYVREHRLGGIFTPDTGFVLRRGPDTLRCPDVAFVSAARLARYGVADGMMEAPPDLAVEILSPSNSAAYVRNKLADYFDAGVRMVWIVDLQRRTVAVHRPDTAPTSANESDTLDGFDVLPGFSCPVAALFENVPRD